MDNDFAQVLVNELRIMNEWLSRIAKSLETTVVETIEYEKAPTEFHEPLVEKTLKTSGMAKLPPEINKSTLDFKKTHKISGNPCKKCFGPITWDYYGKVNHPVHVDEMGKIIGNGTCPEFKGDS